MDFKQEVSILRRSKKICLMKKKQVTGQVIPEWIIFLFYSHSRRNLLQSEKKGCTVYLLIFSKAFDSIQHSLLYFTLIKNGIGEKVFSVLKSMYSKHKSCVNGTDGLTKYFGSSIGL